jgi:L,D-transpeptidase YcbB
MFRSSKLYILFILFCLFFIPSCKNRETVHKADIVADPADMNETAAENIPSVLSFANEHDQKTGEGFSLTFLSPLNTFYTKEKELLWSSNEKWNPIADTLLSILNNAEYSGLYKNDYQPEKLRNFKEMMDKDSLKRTDARRWATGDLMFSNAFMHLIQDLKQGRLQSDSFMWKNDTVKHRTFFTENMLKIKTGVSLTSIIESEQPQNKDYIALKAAAKNFIDSMDTKEYTPVNFPYTDTLQFLKTLKKRFKESGIDLPAKIDSAGVSAAVKKYQQRSGLEQDGKIGADLVRKLNNNDSHRFGRLAVTLDRYKQLPEKMPVKYIWVNLPAFVLKVWDNDTLALESKIICGKPATPTPLLTAAITDIVVFPTWTVPTSIISKDMLPGLKRNSNYLARRGLYLLNGKDERIDPAMVNWAKYTKGIPYRIQQGSGDGNALGVIKFNFNNPFSVYLHDTNQRYLFKNGMRSLSHGCVRVQEWQKLANIIIRNDSMLKKTNDTLKFNTDSVTAWIAKKDMHKLEIKNKYPLFIRYFSCEALKGSLKFYDDIYGDDKILIQKYFAGK